MPSIEAHRLTSQQQEAEVEAIAADLTAELWKPRTARRRLSRTSDAFSTRCLALRKTLERADRALRKLPARSRAPTESNATLQRHFKRLRARLLVLAQIEAALALIRKGRARPLYPQARARHDAIDGHMRIVDAGFRALHWGIDARQQTEDAKALGCFPDIPMYASRFVAHAHAAYRVLLAQKKGFDCRFIDIGCGGGDMVLLASEIFGRADGLDYDQGYVDLASRVMANCGTKRCRAFAGNGLTFDGHGDYDVIYFYQPMSDTAGLEALEDQVLRHARPGTVLIAPYIKFAARAGGLDVQRIEGSVYVAGIGAAEALALRREALRIGPDIFPPERVPGVQQLPWLGALWMACAANGWLPD